MTMAASPADEGKITEAILGETKADLTRFLASQASCIILDPVCAVPGIMDEDVLARDTALLIGLDASGFDTTPEGYRLSKLVPGIDARRVRAAPDRPAGRPSSMSIRAARWQSRRS